MRWLAERGGPIERFHQAMLLRLPAGVQEDHLGAALQAMLDHHDALRLRLAGLGEAGEWTLEIAPAGTVAASSCLRRVDSGELEGAALRACIAEQARAAESGLSPGSGVMLQAVWFDAGPRRAGRLLLTIHHLAVDGVSWRILVPDLAAAWAAIADGREAVLGPRGTSLRRWSQRLAAEALAPGRIAELGVLDRDVAATGSQAG